MQENHKIWENLCRFCGAKCFKAHDTPLDKNILDVIEKLFSLSAENFIIFKVCIDCFSFIELITNFYNQVKNVSQIIEKENLCEYTHEKTNKDQSEIDEDISESIMIKLFNEIVNEDNTNDAQICDNKSENASVNFVPEDLNTENKKPNHLNKTRKCSRSFKKKYEICELCGKKFLNGKKLNEHQKFHFSENEFIPDGRKMSNNFQDNPKVKKKYECQICGKIFSSNVSLEEHRKLHLPVEEKHSSFQCPHCDMTYPKVDSMLFHIQSKHSVEKSFVCKFCNKEFASRNNLYGHQRYSHDENDEKPCPICQKKFTPFRMMKHLKNHREANLLCTICGDLLKSKYNLKRHMLIHSETKAYKCNYCEKDFRLRETLKLHMITHTKLKPFWCRFCSSTFVQLSSCKEHEKKRHPKEYQKKIKDNKTYCSEVVVKLPTLKELYEMLEKLIREEEQDFED
ncbi:zinc finger protein OZF-like isoform X2 [Condylostylus longicornis]|nr:zinc finger protein OZF-like isoform X2 [Condylostylus longicornis]